ncbi:MAG: O-antigen ligase family protein [Clostridia bacterium]|nr:O-antigen ligase family protein [Clostridia bacterium]
MSKAKRTRSSAFFTSFGLLLFLFVYPFFLHNRYFKMTLGKTVFFCCAAFIFAAGCLIEAAASRPKKQIKLLRKNRTELYFGLFLFTAAVSCAASQYPIEALTGANGRYMGLLTLLVIGIAYLFISRCGRLTRPVAMIFGASVAVMSMISLLQFRGHDPFGLYVGTKETVRINFMSLVGNKDVYYSYLALTVPFAMYQSHEAAGTKEKVFWHAVEFFGFAGVFACNSEGAYLGILPAFLFLFFTKCKEKTGLLVFLRTVAMFVAAALLAALIKPDLSQFGIKESLIMQLLLKPLVCAAALLFVALICLAVWKFPVGAGFCKALRIAVACLLAVGAAGLVGAFVYFTFFNKTADIGSFSEFLRFDACYWGNKRGYVWSRLLRLFKEFPIYRMLIGSGPETVGMLMQGAFKEEMLKKTGMTFDNAHNEFIQYLITQGILGLLSYLLFVFNAVKSGLQKGDRFRKAAALCCVCYLAQSVVNISQAITTPLFFVFLALTQTVDESTGTQAAVKPNAKPTVKTNNRSQKSPKK